MSNSCPPVICFRLDIYLHLVRPAPRGASGFLGKQVQGTNMAADILWTGFNDVDPNAVSHTSTVFVNGVSVGTVTLPVTPGDGFTFSYSQLSPPGPVLAAGDQAFASDVTTDNQTPPLSSPPVLSNVVTIQAAQPAPTGVTGFTGQQVGSP